MPGNGPVPFGKGPLEKDLSHGHLASGLLHLQKVKYGTYRKDAWNRYRPLRRVGD